MGYIKARQEVKKQTIFLHQKHIQKVDDELYDSKLPLRIMEVVRQSNALGEPNFESAVDKIAQAASREREVEMNPQKTIEEILVI